MRKLIIDDLERFMKNIEYEGIIPSFDDWVKVMNRVYKEGFEDGQLCNR